MIDEIFDLIDINQNEINDTFTIIFDIIAEINEKNGLAFLNPDRNIDIITNEYTKIGIVILQNGLDISVTKILLEFALKKIEKKYNIPLNELYKLMLIKYLLPYIQKSDFQYIINIQNYLCSCSQEIIYKNLTKIKTYMNIS